jgi:hypothetical protein
MILLIMVVIVMDIKKPLTIKSGDDILNFETLMYLVVSIRFLFCLVHEAKME